MDSRVASSETERWEALVMAGKLQMRRRDADGRWIYREPTDVETEQYLENDAW
jgi:hypothetical protein